MSAPSIEEGNARLLRLADFLETLPPERFNYNTWVGNNWEGKQDLSCGTTACALGWACAMPEFQNLGLFLDQATMAPAVVGKPVSSMAAAEELFALKFDEFEHLFIPIIDEENATPKYVAAKIRAYVKNDRKVYYDLPNEET